MAGVVCTWRGGGSTHHFGDWQTDLYNCTLILESSCWLYNFPTFTCCRLMFMTYIFRHCGLLILKIISIEAHRNVERVCACT